MRRTRCLAIAALALLAARPAHAQYPFISVHAAYAAPDSFYVVWDQRDPDPNAYPTWVGYDVLRREVPGCGAFARINADIVPRAYGNATIYFGGVSPSPASEYAYWVVPVDANRQSVSIPAFCEPCVDYATCEPLTTPYTIGTMYDVSGMLFVNTCTGLCYPGAYLYGPHAEELRPYAGTSTTVRLYGIGWCGGVEGCGLNLQHWDVGPCLGATAVSGSSWGHLKVVYR